MSRSVYRASLFHLAEGPDDLSGWHADGALVVEDGHVAACGAWADIAPTLPPDASVTRFDDALIVPGFVDAHVHYPQLDVVASPGTQLMEWLEKYTFPAEARFQDAAFAAAAAETFLDQLLRHGTTAALVFATVHKASAAALFEAAHRRNMCIATGKVLMDRNAPAGLCDTAEGGAADSQELIQAWHGKGRLRYAVTPRFAPTSSARQLELAGQLLARNPGVLLHTHLSENAAEIAQVHALFPDCADYLGVYEKFGLATDRSVFAHAIHMEPDAWRRLHRHGSSVAFCPTSNLFLGSGLFDIAAATGAGVNVALGTDVGAGTSLSMLQTMNEAYKVSSLRHAPLDPLRLFYLATLGGAKALGADDRIGNFQPGKDADFLVLDKRATPLLQLRLARAQTVLETLFAFAMLGDDRAVAHTYVAGHRAWSRT